MAAGSFIVPSKAFLNLFNATNLLGAAAANWRAALITSSLTPNDGDAGNEVWADVSANEISAGNGYTAGGLALTNAALTQASGVVKFTCDAIQWTASGSGIPAWRYLYIYWLGTLNGKVNPLLAHCLGDSTPADVPLTSSGNPLTVTPHASGIVSVTKS